MPHCCLAHCLLSWRLHISTQIGADVTKPDEIQSMVHEAEHKLGAVDILVNNAGIQHVSPLVDFDEQKWDKIIAVNLSSAFHTTKAALPGMTRRGYGRVINVASAHGRVASKGKAAYCAAKHGVIGLTKVTALEVAGSGVTANSVCPGWVLTPLVLEQIRARAKVSGRSIDEETRALVSEKHPSGQAVRPSDLGQLVAFLCSSAADQITGTELSVDGGWLAQ
jgi:3-hydroxybutyrate dehydrogenase